ncbi:hypothetical protein [Pseudomonas sp. Marseille-Q8238]
MVSSERRHAAKERQADKRCANYAQDTAIKTAADSTEKYGSDGQPIAYQPQPDGEETLIQIIAESRAPKRSGAALCIASDMVFIHLPESVIETVALA